MSLSALFEEVCLRIDRGKASGRLAGLNGISPMPDPSKQGIRDLPSLFSYSVSGSTKPYGYGGGGHNSAIVETVNIPLILSVDRNKKFVSQEGTGLLDLVTAICREIETGSNEDGLFADATLNNLLSEAIQFQITEEEATGLACSCAITLICVLRPRCRGVVDAQQQ